MAKKYNSKKKNLLKSYLKTDYNSVNKPTLKYSTVDYNWLEKEREKGQSQRNKDLLKYSFFGDKKRVKIALNYDNGADINTCDKNGNNALILSVYSRAEEVVKYLLNFNKDSKGRFISDLESIDINHKNKDGISALHLASKLKNNLIMRILLESGANPNVLGKYNQTPIFESVYENDVRGILLLKDYNANLNHKNREGVTPLMLASNNKYRQEALLTLIKLGANLLEIDKSGNTTLMHAANNDNNAIMDILLKSLNYDIKHINSQNLKGINTLMICAKRGNKEAVRVLLARGANPFICDFRGKDAVDYAKLYSNHTCAEIITKAKKIYLYAENNYDSQEDKEKYILREMKKIGKQNRIENSCVK